MEGVNVIDKRQMSGLTLVESLLVLVIAGAIIFMGFQLFQSFRRQNEVSQLQANVDSIFQAMRGYFIANCGDKDMPFSSEYTANNGSLPILLNDLISGGFLSRKLSTSPLLGYPDPDNPDETAVYVMQYNQVQPLPERKVKTVFGERTIGRITIWKAQVAVLLKNQDTLDQYKNMLGANCLSSVAGGGIVIPCDQNSTGSYAVFERMPSAGSNRLGSQSTYWQTMPVVAQFKQMYTTMPILVLVDDPKLADKEFFVCNG